MAFVHTSADTTSGSTSKAGPKVALQSFGVVTRLGQAAVLVELPGAHFAAPAAVQDDAHAGRALGHLLWTLTHGGAGGRAEDLYNQQQNLLLKTETPDTKPHRVTQNNSKSLSISHHSTKHLRPLPGLNAVKDTLWIVSLLDR